MAKQKAIIIGAGPAGLTAAHELLERTSVCPVVFEMTGDVGGIARTIKYKGNRIDLGGHRFFSKSDRVMEWWLRMLPLQSAPARDDLALGRNVELSLGNGGADPERTDDVMLLRDRVSRIFFLRKFFDYPISLSTSTLTNLGIFRAIKIGVSYVRAKCFPIRKERSLEDFFINRFGKELYAMFFKDYTQKVWGKPCGEIEPDWGAQRVKGLSVAAAITHAVKNLSFRQRSLSQRNTETSLIEQFIYPKLGPGQLWQTVANRIAQQGGEIKLNHRVIGLFCDGNRITRVKVRNELTGQSEEIAGDYFLSTMPVKDLIECFEENVTPEEVYEVSQGLMYRDFITVGLLAKKLKITNNTKIKTVNNIVPDDWIYIQEKDVKVGRLQIFNNWSPYLVKDANTVWMGLEYFGNEDDPLWHLDDQSFSLFAIEELAKIGIIEKEDVIDSIVIRMPKTYPAYFGTYKRFDVVREFTDGFENLFLLGRNGMHKYNNQDHSMLTAMTAVQNIIDGTKLKENIWSVNAEQEYHESK